MNTDFTEKNHITSVHKGAFASVFVASFVIVMAFLVSIDAVPETIHVHAQERVAVEEVSAISADPASPEAPIRVVAKDIGLDSVVVNPDSTDIDALDEALLEGAIRYPTSAKLGENGTVLLFGHSTSLPIVRNQVYKTFNGIQNLKTDEIISVRSDTLEYRYRVTKVYKADANEDIIELPSDGKYLTLVTCNTFAQKSDRFVVNAELEGVYALAQ